jgi:hypothetical protein
MNVLIGCEFSGVVRDAFLAKGHNAWSCDLLPGIGPNHIQADVLGVIRASQWDLAIFHPPCTYLCSSGLHWNKRRPGRQAQTELALEFVQKLLEADIPKIALENPIGCISSRIRPPDQIIQPWMFGEDASKATCLWLKGLPKLVPTNIIKKPLWVPCDMCGDFICTKHQMHVSDCDCPGVDELKFWPYEEGGRYANQTPSGQNKLGPSADRWAERSVTYRGIALAMADQWG